MIDVVDGMDLSGVPIPFLEAYPFPAFILAVPIASSAAQYGFPQRPAFSSRSTDRTVTPNSGELSPLSAAPSFSLRPLVSSTTIAWSNEKWLQLTEGRSMEECLGSAGLDRLQDWVEGVESPVEQSLFKLDMKTPLIRLTLSKTIIPLSPPSASLAYCVITSQPRRAQPATSDLVRLGNTDTPPGTPLANPLPSSSSIPQSPSQLARQSVGSDSQSVSSSRRPTVNNHSSQDASSSGRNSRRTRETKSSSQLRLSKKNTSSQMSSVADMQWKMLDEHDWASTKLGPRELWQDAVDPLISVTFQSNTMDCLWLGEDLNLIYNKVYSQLVDHPASFGRPGKEVWAPIWHQISPLVAQVLSGVPVHFENDLLLFKRFGPDIFMETFFNWRYVPITGKKGEIIGFYNQALETTDAVLAERRLITARALTEQLTIAREIKEYYAILADSLEANPKDIPFAMFYSVTPVKEKDEDEDKNASAQSVEVMLESSIGVPEDHPSVPRASTMSIPLKSRSIFGPNSERLSSPTMSAISALSSGSGRLLHFSDEPSWPIQKALSTRQCVLVEDCRSLIQGFPVRHWDQLPTTAMVIPICSENAMEVPEAVIILGLNYRRPLDQDYEAWLNEIRSMLTSQMVTVKGYEQEQMRITADLKMEKAKAAWFQGAAHDLRSPLTLIYGPIQDLLDTTLTVNQKNKVLLAKRNVDRLLRLVNSLMDFSRLEAGRLKGRFVPIDLGNFVKELAILFRPALERLNIEYNVEIEKHEGLVYVDPTLLETVLSNLISNALKYTSRGSVTVRLTFGEFAEVAIIDTGIGIPKDELQHVAQWFHRASTAIGAGTQGTGLGLALARQLLLLHGGDLIVTSKTAEENAGEHGSSFIARIPLKYKAPPTDFQATEKFGKYGTAEAKEAVGWVHDNQTRPKGTPASSESGFSDHLADSSNGGSATGTKFSDGLLFEATDVLLVVDDHMEIRDYIKKLFAPYCQVIEAGNGEEALEMALEKQPDLIVTDCMLPRMSGLELLVAVREQSSKYIPMILLSAMNEEDIKVDAFMAGAEDYMAKPFKTKELLARVHLHMQFGKKRTQLERSFTEKEMQLRFLFEYCPSGIIQADADGKIQYANQAWRSLAGMPEDAEPESWPMYVDEVTKNRLLLEWNPFLTGQQKEFRTTWRWSNGNAVVAVYVRLDLLSPQMTGIIGCVSDITHEEQRVLEAEFRRREAEESKHQQELLIDLTSHEIRTPVSAILQCSSLVKENLVALRDQLKWSKTKGFRASRELLEDLNEDVEALESIYQCGLVQERIAGDILSLARIQLDMLSLHDVYVDLKKEAKKVMSVFASEAKSKKIELVLEFGDSMEKTKVSAIQTDPVRLGQVVTNLISNAIRFTASSTTRKITVTYNVSFNPPPEDSCSLPSDIGSASTLPLPDNTPLYLFVSVRDTGPGLGPHELSILFQRFSQGNKMIHTKFGGSGLGLFICRKITELLKGRIEVQSQLGEGTEFRFFISTHSALVPPVESLVAAASQMSLPSSASRPMSPALSIESSLSSTGGTPEPMMTDTPLHLLIVEDNVINQTVLKRQVMKHGHTCDVANHGLEALNLISEADRQGKRGGEGRQRPYDVIVMDLEMPVMDGLTAIQEIRQAEANGSTDRHIVIALTGNARQGQIEQALAAGMDDVVIKPYVLSDLLTKIRETWLKKTQEVSNQ